MQSGQAQLALAFCIANCDWIYLPLCLSSNTQKKNIARTRRRRRRVTWFNLPYYDEVSTNVSKRFLSMIYCHFRKGSVLGRHINWNTVKVSYSSMANIEKIISGHNKKITGASNSMETNGCNCRKLPYPLDCKCNNQPCVQMYCRQHNGVHWTHRQLLQEEVRGHKATFTHRAQAHKKYFQAISESLKTRTSRSPSFGASSASHHRTTRK